MSFKWSRAGATITSRCTLCSLVLASRLERDIHDGQRAHDPAACQQRRLDAARALATEVYVATLARKPPPKLRELRTHCRDNHEYTPENTRMDGRGRRVCKMCEGLRVKAWRERQKDARESGGMCCGSVELGVAQGSIGSAKTNRPTRERRTVLSTPSSYNERKVPDGNCT
jgi:hypothetical protein